MTKNNSKKINQLTSYQEGSIVSKEIVSESGGSITLFAFDKGQKLSEHKAPYEALVVVTDGVAEITVSGVKQKVEAEEMLLIPANAPHAITASSRFKMMLVMIK
ncbi:MAG: cupin [Microgenomates bacterium 39_7]|nr:MAG: cupin [Microgenomates bacterium 39_7]